MDARVRRRPSGKARPQGPRPKNKKPPQRWLFRVCRYADRPARLSAVSVSAPQELTERKSGAGNESRTRDLNLGKVALYQLSYSRDVLVGGVDGTRTRDPRRDRPVF